MNLNRSKVVEASLASLSLSSFHLSTYHFLSSTTSIVVNPSSLLVASSPWLKSRLLTTRRFFSCLPAKEVCSDEPNTENHKNFMKMRDKLQSGQVPIPEGWKASPIQFLVSISKDKIGPHQEVIRYQKSNCIISVSVSVFSESYGWWKKSCTTCDARSVQQYH